LRGAGDRRGACQVQLGRRRPDTAGPGRRPVRRARPLGGPVNNDDAAAFYDDPANRIPAGPARKRRKSEVVSVRMDQVMVALIRRYAGPDVTVSAWVRRAVQRQLRELRARERPAGLI